MSGGPDPIRPAQGECVLCHFGLHVEPNVVQWLRALLSEDELERADRFLRPEHGADFTVARGMLRAILGNVLEMDPRSLSFVYGEHGKPELKSPTPYFNVSHSSGYAVVALTDAAPVGVDIEGPRPSSDLEKLAQRYFAPVEVEAIEALPEHLRDAAFYRCWSSKEALMKVTGLGLSLGLDKFSVEVSPLGPPGLIAPPEAFPKTAGYVWNETLVSSEMKAVTVVASNEVAFRSIELEPADFC